jgi:hypothetical protein
MIKEIDWKDIMEDNKTIVSGEINMSQAVDTSEFPVDQQMEDVVDIRSNFGVPFLTTNVYENHSFAEIFPDSTEIEFDSLLEDMKEHGQYEPVIIFEDKIADGRTRKKVQDKLQHPTVAHKWLGTAEELLNYLYAKSQHRHLSSQQRAVVALQFVEAERELAKQRQGMRTDLRTIVDAIKQNENIKRNGKDKGRALDRVAQKMGTNRTYIGQAEYVQDKAKELLAYVKRNELSLSNARLLALKLDKPEDRHTAIQQYKNGGGKMLSIVEDILFTQDPAHEVSKEKNKSKPNNNIGRKIVFTMKISESVLEEIKDVLHKHGYSEEPYQILVATNAKEAIEWVEPLLEEERVSTTTYEVAPEDKIQLIDLVNS